MYALTEPISELLGIEVPERSVNAMLRCPFHEDRRPSFSIHLEEGVWHCFSCEQSGTLKGLYRRLGQEVSVDVRIAQAKKDAQAPDVLPRNFAAQANSYISSLRHSERGRSAVQDFIDSRGIRKDAVIHYGLGWDEQRLAISFPYADQTGRVTGIKYRQEGGFKTSEPGSHYGLYGVNDVVGKDKTIICEGESDTLAVWSRYGQDYGVGGTSGASVSDTQWTSFGLHLLFSRTVYLLYDADESGDKCAATALSVLGNDKCVRLRPTDGKDASEYLARGHRLEELGLER